MGSSVRFHNYPTPIIISKNAGEQLRQIAYRDGWSKERFDAWKDEFCVLLDPYSQERSDYHKHLSELAHQHYLLSRDRGAVK